MMASRDPRWRVSIEPPSRKHEVPVPATSILDHTLEALGVIPGTTVGLTRSVS